MGAATTERDLVVMMSVKAVRPTTNPYIVQLIEGLSDRVTVHTFSWRRALTGRVDVFHIHWPEAVFGRDRAWVGDVWALIFAVVLIRMRLSGVAIVRTAHNVAPHEGTSRLASAVLRLCDRVTTLWIRLNPDTELPEGSAVRTILHGHYRAWFANMGASAATSKVGRIVMFGQVRRYKGVVELISAFRQFDDADARLRILGRPSPTSFAADVERAASGDPRVDLALEFIDDERLAEEIGSAELVVLPYRRLHNSGAALLALSLDRPVLVPDGAPTKRLADEVGSEWVHRFGRRSADAAEGAPIQAADIAAALRAIRQARITDVGSRRPDLSGREWADAVDRHVEAYLDAVSIAEARTMRAHTRRRPAPTLH